MAGQVFNKNGMRWTSYDETPNGAANLIDDFFATEDSIRRSTGDIGYGRYNTMDHMFRPVFGKELQAAFMTTDSVQAFIGNRAYSTEGMRLVMGKNSYQMGKDFVTPFTNQKIFASAYQNKYMGVGAATVQDGRIPGGTYIQPELLHIPYKEINEDYRYPLGIEELEKHGDDVGAKSDYVKLMSAFLADAVDKTILRPITDKQPSTAMFNTDGSASGYATGWYNSSDYGNSHMETSLNGLARIISSGSEVNKSYKDMGGSSVTIAPDMVCPWGGLNGDMCGVGSTVNERRLKGITIDSSTGAYSSGTHTKNNWDAQVVDANNASLSLEMLNNLHIKCKQNRDKLNDEGCFFIMSPLMWQKLNNLCIAQRIYQTAPEAYRTIGVGGMTGVKGQDGGISLATYNNQAILVSQNLAFDYSAEQPSESSFGDIFDIDGEHVWMSLLTPLELWNFKQPIVTYDYQERNLFHIREELRADKFVSSGRLTNCANA